MKRGLVAVIHDQRCLPENKLDVDYVTISHVEAITMAVRHLVENGHKKLAFVTASGKSVSRLDKIRGFIDATRAAGLADTAEIIEGQSSARYGMTRCRFSGVRLQKKSLPEKIGPLASLP